MDSLGGASTVSSTGRQVDHLLAVVDFDNGLLTQDLTRALQFAWNTQRPLGSRKATGWSSEVGSRFWIQR